MAISIYFLLLETQAAAIARLIERKIALIMMDLYQLMEAYSKWFLHSRVQSQVRTLVSFFNILDMRPDIHTEVIKQLNKDNWALDLFAFELNLFETWFYLRKRRAIVVNSFRSDDRFFLKYVCFFENQTIER